jgi:phosphoribosylformylglycinamidine synthase
MPGESSFKFALRILNFRERPLKAKVYVTLKSGVLDPQGKAIQHSVGLLGYDGVADVRQGKYFEIALDAALDAEAARETAERMARDVLSNPVIEDYRVEVE